MEKVALNKNEIRLIKNERREHKFEYPIVLRLNEHVIFRNIAMDVNNGNARSLISLILSNGSIKNGRVVSKLALDDVYKCLGVSNSTYKNTVVQNTIGSLGNAIKCDNLKRSLAVKTYHNR